MEQNPIRYQDLISPDDSIEKLISQLQELQQSYTAMANTIKQQAEQVAQSLAKVSGATEQGRKKIKESNSEAAKLEKAYKRLDEAMSANGKEIQRLNRVRSEYVRYQKNMQQRGQEEIRTMQQIKEASYQQLSAQYALNKAYINSLSATDRKIAKNKELIKSTKEIYDQMKRLQADTGKMQLNVGNYPLLGGLVGGLGGKALGLGGAAAAGMALAGVIKDNTSLAQDYEKSLSVLAAILGTTKDGVKELSEQAQHLGATTVYTAKEVAELQTELAKLGYTVDQIQNMAPSVLNFAQATGSSLADAASLAGAALRMFEKDTTHTAEFVDKMSAATTKSALNFQFLQNAMSTVAPVANAFGFKIEEVLALLGQLANAGFDASSAATATRNILLNLADSNGKLAKSLGEPVTNLDGLIKGLKKLEDEGIDLAESLELTDKRSVAAFNTFLAGTDTVIKLRDELNNCNGAAQKMADTMADNLDGSLKSLNSAWEGFNLHINQSNGLLRSLVDWLKDVVVWLDNTFTAAGRVQKKLAELQGGDGKDGKPTKVDQQIAALQGSKYFKKFAYERTLQGYDKRIAELEKNIQEGGHGSRELMENEKSALQMMRDEYARRGKDVLATIKPKEEKKKDKKTKETTTTTSVSKNDLKEQEKAEKESLALRRAYEDAMTELIEDADTREFVQTENKYDRQIEDLKDNLRKKKATKKLSIEDEQLYNNQIEALAKVRDAKLNELLDKQTKKDAESQKKRQQQKEKEQQQTIRDQEKAIELEYRLAQQDIELLETSEKEKTRLRLEAEKERLKKLLALYQQDGKRLSDEEIKLIKKQIEGVNKQLETNKKSNKDIYDVFGFNLSEEKKEGINTALSYSMDALNSWVSALNDAADRQRELADAEVEHTQSVLEAEIQARANGYANDVETARKEVELAKKNQQKAIEQQRKAQRVQIALETVTQASNLITATTEVLKLGFPWFIPALAVMWGTFAAAKVKAWQLAGSGTEQYGEGTVELLDGGSHQSGNDIDLGRKKDGTRRRAEGGEFFAVINKRNSRRYRDVIPDVVNSLNDGTFADKYMNAYDGGAIGVVGYQGANLTKLEQGVDRINSNLEKPTTYFDGKGNQIVIYKNVKRVIKN